MDPGGELSGELQEEVMAGNGQSLREQLDDFLNEQLDQIVISNPRDKEDAQKIKVRPLYLRLTAGKGVGSAAPAADESLAFQAEEFRGKQAFHRNMRKEEMLAYIEEAMQKYKQLELRSELGSMQVLVSKAGKQTVKVKKAQPKRKLAGEERASLETTRTAETDRTVTETKSAGLQKAGREERNLEKVGLIGTDNKSAGVPDAQLPKMRTLTHNRRKRYILEEGRPVPFLKDLGVMAADGKIVNSRYDKFRQINRFLEFIEDILS